VPSSDSKSPAKTTRARKSSPKKPEPIKIRQSPTESARIRQSPPEVRQSPPALADIQPDRQMAVSVGKWQSGRSNDSQ
jgi:hypothetical protein